MCDPDHVLNWTETRTSGQWFGADPIISGAPWLSCNVWVGGNMVDADYVTLGDGNDADCLYRVR